jgi:hypothetical protein
MFILARFVPGVRTGLPDFDGHISRGSKQTPEVVIAAKIGTRRDLNNDGDPEVVIRRNHESWSLTNQFTQSMAIASFQFKFKFKKSEHHQRRAYSDLFPNQVARQHAREDRITPKSYTERLPKYYEETLRRALDAYHESAEDESKVNPFWRNSQNRKSASPKPSIMEEFTVSRADLKGCRSRGGARRLKLFGFV